MTQSLMRQGFDRLMAKHHEADVGYVFNQDSHVINEREREAQAYVGNSGQWTCVDLVYHERLMKFAIWNRTGNVYRVDEHGAAEDDPFITITGGT